VSKAASNKKLSLDKPTKKKVGEDNEKHLDNHKSGATSESTINYLKPATIQGTEKAASFASSAAKLPLAPDAAKEATPGGSNSE